MTILKNIFLIFLNLIIFIKILKLYYHESWEFKKKKKKFEKQLNNVERTWVPQRRFIELDDDKS